MTLRYQAIPNPFPIPEFLNKKNNEYCPPPPMQMQGALKFSTISSNRTEQKRNMSKAHPKIK